MLNWVGFAISNLWNYQTDFTKSDINSFVETWGIKYDSFYPEIQILKDGLYIMNFNFKTRKLIMFFCLFLVSTDYTKNKNSVIII